MSMSMSMAMAMSMAHYPGPTLGISKCSLKLSSLAFSSMIFSRCDFSANFLAFSASCSMASKLPSHDAVAHRIASHLSNVLACAGPPRTSSRPRYAGLLAARSRLVATEPRQWQRRVEH